MKTIKAGDYKKEKQPLKERLLIQWRTMRRTVPYTFAITFLQLINLLLTLWLIPYAQGIIINIVILTILITSLIFYMMNKKRLSSYTKKFRALIRNLTFCLMPLVLLFAIITILFISFHPRTEFPNEWRLLDNSAARFATIDKFRVSQIELKYPVTFKITTQELDSYVAEWVDLHRYSPIMHNLTVPVQTSEGERIQSIGTSYYFPSYSVHSLFGLMNDVFVRVVECNDVWGGVKLEAHSNIRLGLKDYNSNLQIIDSLYAFVANKTEDLNRSYLLCEHQPIPQ
jgi:hypothetical protein